MGHAKWDNLIWGEGGHLSPACRCVANITLHSGTVAGRHRILYSPTSVYYSYFDGGDTDSPGNMVQLIAAIYFNPTIAGVTK